MRILLCSHVFEPNIGGIETVSKILAEQFSRIGSAVTVVTQTPGDGVSESYEVVRRPSTMKLLALGRRADIIWQNHISLRTLLPLLLIRRPIVVTHQAPLTRSDGSIGWQDRLKRALLRTCRNVAISKAVAAGLPVESMVLGNPFETHEFTRDGNADRDKDIVFLGRLVSDKGCDLALRALELLKAEGMCPSLTVIGDGPEMPRLRRLSVELGIAGQVDFRGAMREGRGRELARHKIMVIPSIWAEPFGIVALEGVAAGCAVAASSAGGLPEAVGPCGLLFPNGDVPALAAVLNKLLTDAHLRETLIAGREGHLQQFQPEVSARNYLQIFDSVLGRQSRMLLRPSRKTH